MNKADFISNTFSIPHVASDSGVIWVEEQASRAWQWSVKVLNKHTDLISSAAILAITTCLLAGKIFKAIPSIIPRLAKVVFDFGGIIWLNVQVRDCIKSWRDFSRAITHANWSAIIESAAKIMVKGANILLTSAIFAASVVGACGIPQASLLLGLTIRPLGLACLAMTIATDIRDYFVNETLVEKFKHIEQTPDGSKTIAKVMACFLEIITESPTKASSSAWTAERHLADAIVRQLDTPTVETFQEMLAHPRKEQSPRAEALKLFYQVEDGIRSKQAGTKANLSLIALGYVSMGICRAFPDSVIEMATRLGMSVLFTDELIRQKLFQYDLASNVDSIA